MQATPEVAQSSLLPTITDPKLFVIRWVDSLVENTQHC
jgi:hypothetical protein